MRWLPLTVLLLGCAPVPVPQASSSAAPAPRAPADSARLVAPGLPELPAAALRRVGQPLPAHPAAVVALACAPDGETFASSGMDRTLRVWARASGEELLRLALPERVLGLCYSPDGARLYAYAGDEVFGWECASGAEVLRLRAEAGIRSLALPPAGDRLAVGTVGGTVELFRLADGRRLARREVADGELYSLAWSPDGGTLAGADWSPAVALLDGGSLDGRGALAPPDRVLALAWTTDGRLAVGGERETVRLYAGVDLDATVQGSGSGRVTELLALPEGGLLAGSHGRVWTIRDGAARELFPRAAELSLAPQGLLYADDDGALWRWSLRLGQRLPWPAETAREREHPDGRLERPFLCALDRGGRRLALGRDQGRVEVYRVADGSLEAQLSDHEHGLWSLGFGGVEADSGWTPTLHSRSVDLEVRWRTDTWAQHAVVYHGLPRHHVEPPENLDLAAARAQLAAGEELSAAAWTADRARLAAGFLDGRLEVWDLRRMARIFTGRVHGEAVVGLAFDASGERLASCSADRTAVVFDVTAWR